MKRSDHIIGYGCPKITNNLKQNDLVYDPINNWKVNELVTPILMYSPIIVSPPPSPIIISPPSPINDLLSSPMILNCVILNQTAPGQPEPTIVPEKLFNNIHSVSKIDPETHIKPTENEIIVPDIKIVPVNSLHEPILMKNNITNCSLLNTISELMKQVNDNVPTPGPCVVIYDISITVMNVVLLLI